MPTPIREGYTFTGWYDNTGKKVGIGGETYTPTSNVNLTARWSVGAYQIILDQQGATDVGTTSVTVNYGSRLPSVEIPDRRYNIVYNYEDGRAATTAVVNYIFGGYYTERNGNGIQYYNQQGVGIKNWDRTSQMVLYSKWTAKSITLPTPTREGYTFSGWYTSKTGGTRVGIGGLPYTPTANLVLYARWTANSYTITLDSQGTTSLGSQRAIAYYGKVLPNIAIPSKKYALKYYYNNGSVHSATYAVYAKFDGYYAGVNGSGTQYFSNLGKGLVTWDKTVNMTVYAKWSPGVTTLVTPTREGYNFKGWYTAQTGGSKVGMGGSQYTVRDNTNLYAHWEKAA